MIGVIDYGVGNIQAFLTVFRRIGVASKRICDTSDLIGIDRLVLPGVGHFDHAMARFNDSGLRPEIEELIFCLDVPIIGVCVGMQMLATDSDEGQLPGLNWIPGRVRAFANNPKCSGLAMPHMGWNELRHRVGADLFSDGFGSAPQFYFLHSYYFDAEDKAGVTATAHYGIDFDAVVSRGRIYGVQCHPEKSHRWGEQLLKNFSEL